MCLKRGDTPNMAIVMEHIMIHQWISGIPGYTQFWAHQPVISFHSRPLDESSSCSALARCIPEHRAIRDPPGLQSAGQYSLANLVAVAMLSHLSCWCAGNLLLSFPSSFLLTFGRRKPSKQHTEKRVQSGIFDLKSHKITPRSNNSTPALSNKHPHISSQPATWCCWLVVVPDPYPVPDLEGKIHQQTPKTMSFPV